MILVDALQLLSVRCSIHHLNCHAKQDIPSRSKIDCHKKEVRKLSTRKEQRYLSCTVHLIRNIFMIPIHGKYDGLHRTSF